MSHSRSVAAVPSPPPPPPLLLLLAAVLMLCLAAPPLAAAQSFTGPGMCGFTKSLVSYEASVHCCVLSPLWIPSWFRCVVFLCWLW